MERALKTQDLRLARVKYFDTEHNGAELTSLEAYAFLRQLGDKFINVFDELEELPVLDRSVYPNVMPNGEEFGTRLIHVSGELNDGPCYVIEPFSVRDALGFDVISQVELKEYMYSSPKFFVDRMKLIEQEKGMKRISLMHTYREDQKSMAAFKSYISEHEKAKEYVK